MSCFLSARRLKPGAYDYFRQAQEPEHWCPLVLTRPDGKGARWKALAEVSGLTGESCAS
jgi:hypothetical protein